LDWNEPEAPRHVEILAWYRSLIALRRRLVGAGCVVQADEAAGWLTLVRDGLLAVFNFAPQSQLIPRPPGQWRLEMSSLPRRDDSDVAVPAGATLIFRDVGTPRPPGGGRSAGG
jgi:maltooligosyltrehalose trehalohydrolase